jgi:hypothetical protein
MLADRLLVVRLLTALTALMALMARAFGSLSGGTVFRFSLLVALRVESIRAVRAVRAVRAAIPPTGPPGPLFPAARR